MDSFFDKHNKATYTPLEITKAAAQRYHASETHITSSHRYYRQVMRALRKRGYAGKPYNIPRKIAEGIVEKDLFDYFYNDADAVTKARHLEERKTQHESFVKFQHDTFQYFVEGPYEEGVEIDMRIYREGFLETALCNIIEELASAKMDGEPMYLDREAHHEDYIERSRLVDLFSEEGPYVSDDLENEYSRLVKLNNKLQNLFNYVKPSRPEKNQ